MDNFLIKASKLFHSKTFTAIFFAAVIIALSLTIYFALPPVGFPTTRTIINIPEGSSLTHVAQTLSDEGMIKSPFLYKVLVTILGARRKVQAGDYLFTKPQSTFWIAYRTVHGVEDLKKIKITIPEGIATPDIARLLAKNIDGFDSAAFLKLARPLEGYLFPDTYYFYENVTPQQVIDMMNKNFEDKIKKISLSVSRSGRTFEDVMKMSSIVEKESSVSTDRRIIAGILWKRLDKKQLLQVDVPFFYILGKGSSQITLDDLASDSPYNLYKHLGLPPTPIDNPGLDAIEDTINPTITDYMFYLSDGKGIMHYAETYDGHLANKEKFIQ